MTDVRANRIRLSRAYHEAQQAERYAQMMTGGFVTDADLADAVQDANTMLVASFAETYSTLTFGRADGKGTLMQQPLPGALAKHINQQGVAAMLRQFRERTVHPKWEQPNSPALTDEQLSQIMIRARESLRSLPQDASLSSTHAAALDHCRRELAGLQLFSMEDAYGARQAELLRTAAHYREMRALTYVQDACFEPHRQTGLGRSSSPVTKTEASRQEGFPEAVERNRLAHQYESVRHSDGPIVRAFRQGQRFSDKLERSALMKKYAGIDSKLKPALQPIGYRQEAPLGHTFQQAWNNFGRQFYAETLAEHLHSIDASLDLQMLKQKLLEADFFKDASLGLWETMMDAARALCEGVKAFGKQPDQVRGMLGMLLKDIDAAGVHRLMKDTEEDVAVQVLARMPAPRLRQHIGEAAFGGTALNSNEQSVPGVIADSLGAMAWSSGLTPTELARLKLGLDGLRGSGGMPRQSDAQALVRHFLEKLVFTMELDNLYSPAAVIAAVLHRDAPPDAFISIVRRMQADPELGALGPQECTALLDEMRHMERGYRPSPVYKHLLERLTDMTEDVRFLELYMQLEDKGKPRPAVGDATRRLRETPASGAAGRA